MTGKFFQPSIVIFVEDLGQQIYDQLGSIMRSIGLAECLRNGIGLIKTGSYADYASYLLVSDMLAIDIQAQGTKHGQILASPGGTVDEFKFAEETMLQDGRSSKGSATLEVAVENMLRDVRLWSNMDEIRRGGYTVPSSPELRVQIYIAGQEGSDAINKVLQVVHAQLARVGLAKEEVSVYCMLSRYSSSKKDTGLDSTDLSPQASSLVKFSYVYEDRYSFGGAVTKEESYFAIVQTLYALIVTGITLQEAFEQEMQSQLSLRDDERVGYLITSVITFPRKVLGDYCSAYLGGELMKQWRDTISKGTTPAEKEAQQHHARQSIEEIKRWMEDSLPRPKELFELFSLENTDEGYRPRKSPCDTWADVVYNKEAQGMYEDWEKATTDEWKRGSEHEIHTHLAKAIDRIGSGDISGSNLIRVYIDEFNRELAGFLDDWGKQHRDDYQGRIKNFEDIMAIADKAANSAHHVSGNQPRSEVERLAESWQQYFAWEQAQVLSVPTLVVTGLLVAPPLVLIMLTLFPAWPVLAIIGIIGLVLSCNVLFHLWQRRRVVKVRNTLLNLYNLYLKYAHDCELHEDKLRQGVKDSLGELFDQKVQAANEHRHKIENLISQVEMKLQDSTSRAQKALEDLFDSPEASRNVLVDDRKAILTHVSYEENVLQNLAKSIARQRYGGSDQGYDRNRFFESLQDRLVKISTMDENSAQEHVLTSIQPIVDTCLEDRSLGKATGLDDSVWDRAYERVRSPLARSQVDGPRLLFICGGNAALVEKGKTYLQKYGHETVAVHTDNTESLLLAAFFRGSSPVPQATPLMKDK